MLISLVVCAEWNALAKQEMPRSVNLKPLPDTGSHTTERQPAQEQNNSHCRCCFAVARQKGKEGEQTIDRSLGLQHDTHGTPTRKTARQQTGEQRGGEIGRIDGG